eukprot:TRINITY_DN3051_c0_g1_i1.p3 TRINITY_DN3051_c0_g1~~TRINITY_DN3051_c0_g1_i1.p3  ORF type:complete len:138 (-),score=5.92 TRINITY_DN3051_c0_g1_i1:209-622(-)
MSIDTSKRPLLVSFFQSFQKRSKEVFQTNIFFVRKKYIFLAYTTFKKDTKRSIQKTERTFLEARGIQGQGMIIFCVLEKYAIFLNFFKLSSYELEAIKNNFKGGFVQQFLGKNKYFKNTWYQQLVLIIYMLQLVDNA